MSILIKNGGSNRVTLDGKPPKERIDLKRYGDEANLNFIRFPTIKKHPVTTGDYIEIKGICEVENTYYMVVCDDLWYTNFYILKYTFENGFDKEFIVKIEEGTSGACGIIKDGDYLYFTMGGNIFKFDINKKTVNSVSRLNKSINKGSLLKFNNSIYYVYFFENYTYVYNVTTSTNEFYSEMVLENSFIYGDKMFITTSKKIFTYNNGNITEYMTLPNNGECLKVKDTLHFLQGKRTEKEATKHYVLNKNNIWEQKDDMDKGAYNFINFFEVNKGLLTLEDSGINKIINDALVLITDELYL